MKSELPIYNDVPQSVPDSGTDWRTWSPFQSQAVRDICANMTPAEKSAVTRRGLIYGLGVVISVGLPVQFVVMGLCRGNLTPMIATISGVLVVAHMIGIPIWQRRQRQFDSELDDSSRPHRRLVASHDAPCRRRRPSGRRKPVLWPGRDRHI